MRRLIATLLALLGTGALGLGALPARAGTGAGAGTAQAASVRPGVAQAPPSAVPACADRICGLEYWLQDYGIRRAWATSEGAGVTVAVIDTGVDGSVPDLEGAVVGGADFSGRGAANGQRPVGDESGHGTWVASLLAGRGTGPGAGLYGVAPAASILSVSVGLGGGGVGESSDDQIAKAVRWSVDHGASVINLSLTRNTLGWPPGWDDAFEYAFDHDVVVVAAAGNRGSGTAEVGAPATIPGVLGVAGVDRRGHASTEASSQGITLGVAAPSEDLIGADPSGGYVRWAGTSGAAPIVAGIVALVRSAHPGLDANNVIHRILATAHPVGKTPSPRYGYGLVDAEAAVTATVPSVSENPLGSLTEWVTLHRRADSTATPAPEPSREAAPAERVPPEHRSLFQAVAIPGWGLVTLVGIPMLLVLGFACLLTLLVLAFRRHFGGEGGRE